MSAYDLTDCPSDPVEPARERLRDLMTRENPGDPLMIPDAEPKAIKGWPVIVGALCLFAIFVSMIAEVL